MKIKISPFILLCLMGGLAIFSSTMAKNPALPLFIRSMGVPLSTVGFIAAASTVVGIIVSLPASIQARGLAGRAHGLVFVSYNDAPLSGPFRVRWPYFWRGLPLRLAGRELCRDIGSTGS